MLAPAPKFTFMNLSRYKLGDIIGLFIEGHPPANEDDFIQAKILATPEITQSDYFLVEEFLSKERRSVQFGMIAFLIHRPSYITHYFYKDGRAIWETFENKKEMESWVEEKLKEEKCLPEFFFWRSFLGSNKLEGKYSFGIQDVCETIYQVDSFDYPWDINCFDWVCAMQDHSWTSIFSERIYERPEDESRIFPSYDKAYKSCKEHQEPFRVYKEGV